MFIVMVQNKQPGTDDTYLPACLVTITILTIIKNLGNKLNCFIYDFQGNDRQYKNET